MRRMIDFECKGDRLIGSLDWAEGSTGLLIVSGGNEIRSGAYAGQSAMARHFAQLGYPVLRYDRRGVGDSEGSNVGFANSADDIAAAVAAFRKEATTIDRIVAFGNCDAATALALHHDGISSLVLANPWVIETENPQSQAMPSAAAVRGRYLARLKNPRSLVDLITGKIDLRKLASGLARAVRKDIPTGLATQMAAALAQTSASVSVLIADRDTTAMAFLGAYRSQAFDTVRTRSSLILETCNTASHSFADETGKAWLYGQIERVLANQVRSSTLA